jgi:four helix bundle protein
MALIRRFEDILAWQNARKLLKKIYQFTGAGAAGRDFEYKRQIRSAAVSIMSNIAEGFERGNRKEFARFLDIAKGSSCEVRSLLYAALDLEYIDRSAFDGLSSDAQMISQQLANLARHRKKSPTISNHKASSDVSQS